jgi:hypothetical protein
MAAAISSALAVNGRARSANSAGFNDSASDWMCGGISMP